MTYINISFIPIKEVPDLKWTLPNFKGDVKEDLEGSWNGRYICPLDTSIIYGHGEGLENWVWVVAHESLHHILTNFIYDRYRFTQYDAYEQEYIIDKLLGD